MKSPCTSEGTNLVGSGEREGALHRAQECRNWIRDFSHDERKLFMREILREYTPNELDDVAHLISTLVVNRLSVGKELFSDPFAFLPTHITVKILRLLDPVSLCHASLVSRSWRTHSGNTAIWRALCQGSNPFRLSSEEDEAMQIRRHTSCNGHVRWKAAFCERYRLWSNWHAGRCVVRTFSGHTQGVTCVQFDSQRIVSGSSDTTIRIWDLRSTETVALGTMTLNGHSSTVRCLDLKNNILVSGSNDFSIKVWDVDVNPRWSSVACRKTMLGHTNIVRCIQMEKTHLMSGSYDCTVKLWSLEDGRCTQTMNGHLDAVLCAQYSEPNGFVVSGSADYSIKCWDTRMAQDTMTIHNAHENAVTCVRFDNYRIVSGSVDRAIKFWDMRIGRCIQTIDWKLSEGHTGVVRCLQVDSWRLVSAADDRTVKVWNLRSGERLCTLRSHEDGVTCVQFSDKKIVSGSYDRTVKLWDFSSIDNHV